MDVHNPPAAIDLAEDFRFPPVGVNLHAVSFDFRVEVPVVFHPGGVAHQMNCDVAWLEMAISEIVGKELVQSLYFIPAVGVPQPSLRRGEVRTSVTASGKGKT